MRELTADTRIGSHEPLCCRGPQGVQMLQRLGSTVLAKRPPAAGAAHPATRLHTRKHAARAALETKMR